MCAEKKEYRKPKKSKRSTSEKASSVEFLPLVLPLKVQTQIHKKALSRCSRAFKAMELLQNEISDYFKYDETAYHTWYQENFKLHLSKRDTAISKLRDLGQLVFNIEREVMYSNISPQQAYLKIMAAGYVFTGDTGEPNGFSFGQNGDDDFECDCENCTARRNSSTANQTDTRSGFDSIDSAKEAADLMFEEMAQDLFEQIYGDNFETNRQRRKTYEKFKRKLDQESGFSKFKNSFNFEEDASDSESSNAKSPTSELEDVHKRCLYLYRYLVKRLHPDAIINQTRVHKELWQMTQDAYNSSDYAKLKRIHVLVNIEEFSNNKVLQISGTAVSDVQEAADELLHKNNQTRKQIRQLKRGELWGFARLTPDQLQSRFKSESSKLENELRSYELQLSKLYAILKRYSNGKVDVSSKASKQQSEKTGDMRQEEFAF